MVTVTGKLESALNGATVAGNVQVMLCGYGSTVPRINGVALIARIRDANVTVASDGTFSFTVSPNDTISPAGTYYTVQIKDDNGDTAQVNAYRFLTSPPTYDLGLINPYDPIQPPPPLPPLITNLLLIVPNANNMVFDGSGYTAFKTTLTGDVNIPTIQNMMPGNLYTFIILQNSVGGNKFVWPANMHNAAPINPAPNGRLIQTFVAESDGSLWAIGAATW
jgi:hypothetical protein